MRRRIGESCHPRTHVDTLTKAVALMARVQSSSTRCRAGSSIAAVKRLRVPLVNQPLVCVSSAASSSLSLPSLLGM